MVFFALLLLGLLFGSFINALVWRLKTKRPIVNDRSMCPECTHKLSSLDLIPVFSWLVLRGKCRYCHKPISAQYPLVELATAILFSLSYIALKPVSGADWLAFGLWLIELVVLIALAVYDLRWMILPDKLMSTLLALAVLNILLQSALNGSHNVLSSYLWAAVIAGGFFYGLFAGSKGRWMGGGDVKLAFVMGLMLGLRDVLVAMFIGFNSAAIVSIVLIATHKMSRKSLIPFGPFLILGTIFAMLYGGDLFGWYKNLILG